MLGIAPMCTAKYIVSDVRQCAECGMAPRNVPTPRNLATPRTARTPRSGRTGSKRDRKVTSSKKKKVQYKAQPHPATVQTYVGVP